MVRNRELIRNNQQLLGTAVGLIEILTSQSLGRRLRVLQAKLGV